MSDSDIPGIRAGSEGKRARNKRENRAMILQAALRVFSDPGFEATTVRDIVRQTGLASGTFYNYFRTKEDVFEALLDESALRIRPRLHAVRQDARTFAEFLEATFRTFFEHVAADRAMFEMIRRNSGCLRVRTDSPEVVAGLAELRADIDGAIADGRAPAIDADYLAGAIVGIAFETADRMMRRDPPDTAAATAFAASLILGGVAAASDTESVRPLRAAG